MKTKNESQSSRITIVSALTRIFLHCLPFSLFLLVWIQIYPPKLKNVVSPSVLQVRAWHLPQTARSAGLTPKENAAGRIS